MELILVVVISAGMAENSQNGVSRSLKLIYVYIIIYERNVFNSTFRSKRHKSLSNQSALLLCAVMLKC